ncbi:MAG: hypothetical protein JWO06_582, partial [Bacteroidota bacterium]|nr:hypothetical protein [Bacteroidota bacterium]
MRWLGLLVMLFSARPSSGQQEAVFKVTSAKAIALIPDLDTLISGQTYFFKLEGTKPKDLAGVKFSGGTILLSDSGLKLSVSPNIGETPDSGSNLNLKGNYKLSLRLQNKASTLFE